MGLARALGVNRTVVALSVARMGDAIGNSILFIALPLYVAKLSSPLFPFPESVRVGILLSLYGLVSAALQSVTGAWSDHLGRRKPLIIAGLVIMTVGTLGFIPASHFADLLVLRTLQGLGVALTVPASMALMAAATTRETRGGSMGVYTTARMVGFAAGPLLGGALLVHSGFVATFVAGAAFVVVGLVLVVVWISEPLPPPRAERPARLKIFDRRLIPAGIIGASVATFLMASAFSMMTTLEKQFNDRLHQNALAFSVAFSALMISRLAFQAPLGSLSDRIGRKPLLMAGLFLMGPTTAALGWAGSTTELTVLRLFQGLAAAAIAAPAFALTADLSSPGNEGRQMSMVTASFGLGIALGPLIAGILAVHSFELPFLIGGGMCLLGVGVVARWVPETVHRR